ncbi:alpha/beta fold hydrolase [Jannaschia sp. KMU-145]|uniref:alpha/beta fold hydrolase n=1 Tax=Jannaschia halovivens TaxID=3388667 RepID=UPI00396B271F
MSMPDPAAILAAAADAPGFFDGFDARVIPVGDGHVFCRIGGSGPPILLLHGYPQTSAMWHRIAPVLARTHTVICADLRGYGRSAKPPTDADHAPYSKRAMAGDLLGLMDALGHDRFLVGAHDRGARVTHRLAADHPGRVRALATLDIAPTREMYATGDSAFAATYWHWYWLIQPAPFPETLIGHDPDAYWVRKCCTGSAGATPFVRPALKEYLDAFRDPATIHASCEDYRAAWGIDIAHDDAEQGKLPMPLLALWGRDGAIERHFDCLALWRRRASDVTGQAIAGGHYLAEECPDAVLAAWTPFFEGAPA